MSGPRRVRLPGGFRNDVWKVRDGRGWLIEKHYSEDPGEANPMYPNLADHEAAALAALGPRGLAPQLVRHERGVITYRFVPGTMWRSGVNDVAALLHDIHSGPAPRGLRQSVWTSDRRRTTADEATVGRTSRKSAAALADTAATISSPSASACAADPHN